MPKVTWEEISELVHQLRDERIIVMGAKARLEALNSQYKDSSIEAAIKRLKTMDKRLNELEISIMNKILNHEDEDE
jgi:molybdopterin-guanine dinucleotide biosynthesis protein A